MARKSSKKKGRKSGSGDYKLFQRETAKGLLASAKSSKSKSRKTIFAGAAAKAKSNSGG